MTKAISLALLAVSAAAPAAGLWRATALDPRTVVLQGDYTPDERAAFRLTDAERALTGWKVERAFAEAAARAQAHRPGTEAKLAAGPYAADGAEVAAFAHWKYPIGAARFPDGKGGLKGVKLAEVMQIVYLKLARPLADGAKATFALPTGETVPLAYSPRTVATPLIKVNQVGYAARQGKKFAYFGGWLGPDFGAYEPADGLRFELVDEKTGKAVREGALVRRAPDRERDGVPFCGEKTLEMDFSDVTAPGRYFVRIPGVGRSLPFAIDDAAVGAAFAVHMKGLFHQRCGCAKPASLTHWTDAPCHLEVLRGVHPPNEWEYGSCFTDGEGKPVKTKHFPVIAANARDLTERLSLPGGWHDAADFDRRPMHLEIVNGLLAAYLLRPANFTDSQLAVPERGNGIPDVLDEALWGLRHLRAAQQADGGVGTWIETRRHPAPNDGIRASGDGLVYCLSRATRNSSLLYAAHAALLARAFRQVGAPSAKKVAADYERSAVAAWRYSRRPAPGPVRMRCGWREEEETEVFYREPEELDPNDEVKAAVNLFSLTGDRAYLAVLGPAVDRFVRQTDRQGWSMAPERHVEFLFTEVPGTAYGRLREHWNARVLKDADAMLAQTDGPDSYAYRVPWFPSTDWRVSHMSWGSCHPLRRAKALCYAHALTGKAAYLDAAYLANDFHNGCNPNGTTWTAGLGAVWPVKYLSVVSLGDGIAEYVPGVTPYRSTFALPHDARALVWQDDRSRTAWPYWRRYANLEEHSVAVSEFTVWETIAPAAFTTGYLMTPGAKFPLDRRAPARDLRDLPGYWALP